MSRNRPPAVSVVVTVRNGGRLTRIAVESILDQTLEDLEVVVVDDGSQDGTPTLLRDLGDERVRLVAHPAHLGRTRCLNQAISLARADLVAIMDADDLAFPDRLARQVAALRRDPRLDLVGARMLRIDAGGNVIDVGPQLPDPDRLEAAAWRGIPIPHPTWCGRRRWFETYPYRPWMRWAEDQELLYRALPLSRFACLSDVLLVKRERDLPLSLMVRRHASFSAGALLGDAERGRWSRAASTAMHTAGAAARFLATGGRYDPTWRWEQAGDDVLTRYELLMGRYSSEALVPTVSGGRQ